MSWNNEYSISDGQPVKLYELIRGDNEEFTYYYTDADKNIVFNSNTYNAIAISDNGVNGTTDNNLTLTLPDNNPVVLLYRGVPPTSIIRLRVRVLQGNEARLVWAGKILECQRPEPGRAELIASNIILTFSQSGPRLAWGRACPYAVYDDFCKVNKLAYKDTAVIKSLTGTELSLGMSVTRPKGWFDGGFIEWLDNGVKDSRHIISHDGRSIALMGGTSRLTAGLAITLYPGCGRTIGICHDKFSNHLNYGGVPGMPGISPFNGNKIF